MLKTFAAAFAALLFALGCQAQDFGRYNGAWRAPAHRNQPKPIPPFLFVVIHPMSPSGDIVMGTTNATGANFEFIAPTTNTEGAKLMDLRVCDVGPKAIFTNLKLWIGQTLLGTAAATVPAIGTTGWCYDFHLTAPPTVAPGETLYTALNGDIPPYSTGIPDATPHQFYVSESSMVRAIGASTGVAANVFTAAYGYLIRVLRSTLAVSTQGIGGNIYRAKSTADKFGTIYAFANNAGAIILNRLTVTFGSNVGQWTTPANVKLLTINGGDLVTLGAATVTTNTLSGSATWTFNNGVIIPAGASIAFTVQVNSAALPMGTQSLTAMIYSTNDVIYADGGDATTTQGLTPTSLVAPITINSVTYQ